MPSPFGRDVLSQIRFEHLHSAALCFGKSNPGTTSQYMETAGRIATREGYPVPLPGHITGLSVFDGTTPHFVFKPFDEWVSFDAGDRIGIYLAYEAPWFDVTVRKNGVDTSIFRSQVLANQDLTAIVSIRMNDIDRTT